MVVSLRRNRAGMSLVEVVVALAVIAVGMFGVLEMFLWSRSESAASVSRAKASATARGVVETWRAAGPAALGDVYRREPKNDRGETVWPDNPRPVEGNDEMFWQARLAPVTGNENLIEVRVAARWGESAANPLDGTPGDSVSIIAWLPVGSP